MSIDKIHFELKSLLLLLLIALPILALPQDCNGDRYREPIFPEVIRTNAIAFGSNINLSGSEQILYMDVYEPAGDLLLDRPIVIVAFGGSFISGDRNDVSILCEEFAKRGYVAIAPDYRIGLFEPDPVNAMLAVIRGTHDLKGCIRFLRRSVAEDGNPWNIDPDRIIVGGVSAGAIAALHATYMSDASEFPPQIAAFSEGIGGVEGESGNAGYSSAVAACYSFSGAIGDTSWIDAGEPPLASIHDIGDQVVPYYTQEFMIGSEPIGLVAAGSHDIHLQLEDLGTDHCLLSYPGNGHVNYLLTDAFNALSYIFNFTASVVCGGDAYCGAELVNIEPIHETNGQIVHLDPANEQVTFGTTGAASMIDMNGREVLTRSASDRNTTLHIGALPAGIYIIKFHDMPYSTQRLVITR